MRGCGNRGAGRRVSCSSGLDTASGTQPTGYSEVIAIITDKSEFVNTAVPWFSFQREIVDRAVLSLKDAGVPFLFDRVKKLPKAAFAGPLFGQQCTPRRGLSLSRKRSRVQSASLPATMMP